MYHIIAFSLNRAFSRLSSLVAMSICVCVVVQSAGNRISLDWRLQVEEHISKIAKLRHIFLKVWVCFGVLLFFFFLVCHRQSVSVSNTILKKYIFCGLCFTYLYIIFVPICPWDLSFSEPQGLTFPYPLRYSFKARISVHMARVHADLLTSWKKTCPRTQNFVLKLELTFKVLQANYA